MFILKSAKVVSLTPQLAEEHLKKPALTGERPLRQSRVNELVDYILAGTFNNPTWVIVVLKGGGKEFRADGQHTATALTSVPPDKFPTGCKVLIVYYEIDSLDKDASGVFLRIDDSDAVRNAVATMNSLTVHYKDLHEVTPQFKVLAVNGIVYHLKELNKNQKDRDKRVRIYKPKLRGLYLVEKSYRIFAFWLHHWNNLKDDDGEYRKASNAWLMHKPALMAEAMANYFAHSEAATKFWDYMLDDAGPKGHPTKELVNRFNDWRSRPKPPAPERWRDACAVVWRQFLSEYNNGKGGR